MIETLLIGFCMPDILLVCMRVDKSKITAVFGQSGDCCSFKQVCKSTFCLKPVEMLCETSRDAM